MSDNTGIRKFEERWVFDEVRQASGGEVQGKSMFWHWTGLLSDDVCDLIIKEGKALPQLEGGINVPDDGNESHHREIHEDLRKSMSTFFPVKNWITGVCLYYGYLANQYAWHYELGWPEPIQFSQYGVGDHYTWHIDSIPNTYTKKEWEWIRKSGYNPAWYDQTQRKLSLTVNLSDPTTYEGGDVEFLGMMGGIHNNQDLRQRGTVIAFPSFVKHRVTKVTKGKRCSLVVWITGAPFK